METWLPVIINLVALALMFLMFMAQVYNARRQRPAFKAVTGCEEQLKASHEQVDDLKAKLDEEIKKREGLEKKVDFQEQIIRVQFGTNFMLMEKLGIPTTPTPPLSHPPLRRERTRITVVGVWAEQASLATLDLRTDLEGVIDASGNWAYRPLIGKVTGEDLERELVVGGGADILYIAAHADEEGIYFSDQKYSAAWLGELASRYGVKLVVLNACKTRQTAQYIRAKGVPSVAFAIRDVPDKTAIVFARAFFLALAMGNSVPQAVESGQRTVAKIDQKTSTSMFGSYGDWNINADPLA